MYLDVLIPLQKSHSKGLESKLSAELDKVVLQLKGAPSDNSIIEPSIELVTFLFNMQNISTISEYLTRLKVLHFFTLVGCVESEHNRQSSFKIKLSLDTYILEDPLFTLRWNNSDLSDYQILAVSKLVSEIFVFDCSAIIYDELESVFEKALRNSPRYLYLLKNANKLSESALAYLIENCLVSYKSIALRNLDVNSKPASAEVCDFFSREKLLYAEATAKKATVAFPSNPQFQQALKKIRFIAKMDLLKQKGLPVTAADYVEARETYEPESYQGATTTLNPALKNVGFYNAFRNCLMPQNAQARQKTEGIIIDLLKPLESKLRQKYSANPEIIAALEAIPYPQEYYSYGPCVFPVAPQNYKKTTKQSALVRLLEEYFRERGFLPRGVFARFVGFVETNLANKVVEEGNLFVEHTLLMSSNIHGKLTHVLQLYLMLELIKAGILNKPEGTSEFELVTDLVKLKHDETTTLWTPLIDNVGHGYATAYELNTFLLMNKQFRQHCPLLHAYSLDSFFAHQQKARQIFVTLHGLNPDVYSNLQFLVLYTVAFRVFTDTRYPEELGVLGEKRKRSNCDITLYESNEKIIFKTPRFFKSGITPTIDSCINGVRSGPH